MNIAIFGGSFNPVHKEHVSIVKSAIRELSLDKAIIMPSNITPSKTGRMVAESRDRLNMCRLAFAGVEGAEVSDYEINKGGVSYSYITCREFRSRYPGDNLYFIVGADMFESFSKWKNPEEILSCVNLAVCARENVSGLEKAEGNFIDRFGRQAVNKYKKFSFVGAKISSTRIRTLAALGESLEAYVDEKTANYIKEQGLYSIPALEDCLNTVKSKLTPSRWAHTVGVAITAAENCSRLGIAEERAITAAALHDCAKYLKPDDSLLKGFNCPENVPPPVVHQFAGAYVAENAFNITDAEIVNAIKYHTSGRANMGGLEKLIYLSDMLEEGRNFACVEYLRAEFAKSLDGGLYAALKHQFEYLKKENMPVYPLTEQAYEYVKNKKENL